MLAYTPVDYNYLKTLAKTFTFTPDKINSFMKTISPMLQFAKVSLQGAQTLHSWIVL